MPDWDELLADLERRRAAARAMGGPEKRARHGAGGSRLDARQRVEALLDPGSFRELGLLAGAGGRDPAPADALVAGAGRIDGRPVLVGAEDFTVKGGSIGPAAHAKRVRLAELAAQERAPLVMLLEGAGERASNALERHAFAPNDLQALVRLAGRVPTVAVVMGASAGHGALTAPLLDYVVMTRDASLFSAGPPLVAAATGERVDKQTLGGPDVHCAASGVAHDEAADDAEALARVRAYLSYFPSNAWERPPRATDGEDLGPRRLDELLELVPANPRKAYDMRRVVSLAMDRGSVLELQARFGTGMLTALARLGGRAVAVVANQPAVRGGAVDREAAEKAARFLQVADAFHLPAVFLADNPGVMAGTAAERSGALRAAARLFAAQARLRGPKLHVTLRKAYGFGSSLMAMNPFDRQTVTLAFPGATLGAMPAAGGGRAAGADAATQRALDAGEAGGPWRAAGGLAWDDVIDPRELRDRLLDALALADARAGGPVEPAAHPGIWP